MGKEHALLVFAILTGIAILTLSVAGYFKTTGQGNIAVVLSKQDGDIVDLNTPRKISEQRLYRISRIAFPEGDQLRHKDLGVLPYSQNYYLDFTGEFKVLSAGDFEFRVTSDDGFRFYVDNVLKFENPGPRRFETSKSEFSLAEGKHHLKLEYFQQGGQAGLEVSYQQKGQNKFYFIGENSMSLNFD